MKRALVAACAGVALALAGCASDGLSGAGVSDIYPLGVQYDSPVGGLLVLDVQDEYRLVRAVSAGAISRGYEDLFSVPKDGVRFNRWMRIEKAPGLDLAIVSPTEVAFRFGESSGVSK